MKSMRDCYIFDNLLSWIWTYNIYYYRMTFPDILDLNDFVHEKAAAQPKMSYAAAAKKF